MVYFVLLAIFLSQSCLLANGQPEPPKTASEALLINHLLQNYNPNARPVRMNSEGVELTYDIALKQLLKVNEREQIITTNVWIRHYWNDPFLKWVESDWNGTSYLALDPSIIWKPDITLYNNAEREFQGFDEFGKTRINVYSNGLCVWLLPIILRSQCKMNLQFFPFDEQHCPMTFGSWAYDGGSLVFNNRNPTGDITSFTESGEFLLTSLNAERISTKYACCPNPYYTITYTVHLVRRAKFYLYNLVIPGVLIAMLSIFSFFLPPLSGERTGLIITNFLSISVYILMVSDNVPPSSNIPLLVKFYTELICEIGLALVLNCIVIPLAARNVPMPYIIRKIFLQKLAYLFCCRRKEDAFIKKIDTINVDDADTSNGYVNSSFNENITYSKNIGSSKLHESEPAPYLNGNSHAIGHMNVRADLIELRRRKSTDMGFKEQSEIGSKLEDIRDLIQNELHSRRHNEDWVQLTLVLDRIFFLLFLLTIVWSVSLTLAAAPNFTM